MIMNFIGLCMTFFRLNRRIDIDKLLRLKLNPFCMNKYDVHSLLDSDLELKNCMSIHIL